MWYRLFFEREDLGDKNHDENEDKEEDRFSRLVEEYRCHAEKKGQGVHEVPHEILGHPHIEKPIVEVMDPVAGERTFLVVEPHEDDIEGIDEVHPKDGRNGRDFPAGYDSKRRDHKGDEHRPGFPEKHMGLDIIKPADKHGRDEYRKTEQHEYGIGLREGRGIYEVEFDGQYRHDQQGDEGEPGSESRNPVRPVDRVEDEHIPDDREDKRDEINLDGSENDIVLIQVENPTEYIGNIPDFYARDPDDCSNTDLHNESHFCRYEERRIAPHLPELFRRFFDIAFTVPIEFMNGIQIIYEAYDGHHCSEYEDNKETVLIDAAEERMEEE